MTVNDTPTRLHLGCADFAPAGWLNCDGSWHVWLARWPLLKRLAVRSGVLPRIHLEHPWPKGIVHLDLRGGLPFAAGRFSAVYASHVLEHLYRDEALALLREAHRCCRPGGVVRMAVPDLRHHATAYLDGTVSPGAPAATAADTLLQQLHLHPASAPRHGSRLRTLYHALFDFNSHKWLYDAVSLAALFREAGFARPRERGILESAIAGIEAVERPERIGGGGTVIVEAVKGEAAEEMEKTEKGRSVG